MKQEECLKQLKNLIDENGKRRKCSHIRLSPEWVSLGEENDADSSGYRGKNFSAIGISA